jgi:threonine dehydrogenase-like Zn-dependent dehydrogenase
MKQTMKAAVLYGKRDLRIEEVPIPEIAPHEVLVKMKIAGISGIEPIIYEGGYIARKNIIMGFQAAGIVEKIGKDVREVERGMRVGFDPNLHCGYCWYCKRGRTLQCENLKGYGVHVNGTFSEYFAVPESNIYQLPESLSFEYTPIIEHASCVLHSIEASKIEMGDIAVILGSGLIGSLFIQLLKKRGSSVTIAVDISEKKLDKAKELGADYCILSKGSSIVKEVLNFSDGRGADIIIDTAGVPTAFEDVIKAAAKGARVTIFATYPEDSRIEIHPFSILEKEIVIQGTYCNPLTFGKTIAMIASGAIDVKALISDEVTLDRVEEGIIKKRDSDIFYVLVRND